MGIIKKLILSFIKTIFSLVFILSLSSFLMIWSLEEFTNYNNMKSLMVNLYYEQMQDQIDRNYIEYIHSNIKNQCLSTENETISFVFTGKSIKLKCDDIITSTSNNFMELVFDALFESFYFEKHQGSLIETLKQPRRDLSFILFSYDANQELKTLKIYALSVVIVSGMVLGLATSNWSGRLRVIGTSLIIVGLPVLTINVMKNSLEKMLISESGEVIPSINMVLDNLFEIMYQKFTYVLVLGVVLTVLSLVFWLYEKFKKH